jgi:hypothetical protein
MKPIFIVLLASFLSPSSWHKNYFELLDNAVTRTDGGDPGNIQLINTSSLKRLPAILKDLSAAFKESIFQKGDLLSKNGFTVCLYDMPFSNFETSASVNFNVKDTIYHVELNKLNQKATDKALATTLIHEIMHCVLLDIYKRAKLGDENSLANIINSGLLKNDTANNFHDYFFQLMNSGNDGQHELIYRFFYTQMVSLLENFSRIHKQYRINHEYAKCLMWSGLQTTSAYKRLSNNEKKKIEWIILDAKRFFDEE